MAKDKVKDKSSGSSSNRKNTAFNTTVNVNSRFSCLKNDNSEKNNTEKIERKEIERKETVKNRSYKEKDYKDKEKDYKKDKSGKASSCDSGIGIGESKGYKTEEKVVVAVEEDIPVTVENNVKTLNYLTVAKKIVPSKKVKNKDVDENEKNENDNHTSNSGSGSECSNFLKDTNIDTRRGIGLKVGNKVYSLDEYEKIMEEQKKLDDKNCMKRKMSELVKKWESDRKKYIELYGYDNYETVFKFKNYDYHYFDKLDHQYRINNYYTVDDDSNYSEDDY
jgi:hypothetical protein